MKRWPFIASVSAALGAQGNRWDNHGMLKQRLLTGAILGSLSIWAMLALSTSGLAALLGLFYLMGAWEWGCLSSLRTAPQRAIWMLGVVVVTLLIWWLQWANLSSPLYPLVLLGWGLVCWVLFRVRFVSERERGKVGLKWLFLGLFALVPSYLALVTVHGASQWGPKLLLYIVCLLWVVDTGAYFAGKRWGRDKLAPILSPGKTWQGVAGGLLAATFYAVAGLYWLDWPANQLGFILLTLFVASLSVVGDLLESLLKREAGAKDSGRILPGHGGVLDRIDSLLAAAPIFVAGLAWF
ncbi:MAG: phosphatidate cytidylyltransferase [Gammaproteobacteria bacterium]|nr:phosphatidate cytidylyltransferase [Gammaproteobacteria bacterium]